MKYCLGLCLLAFFSNAYADNADVAARERYMKDFRSANKAIGRLLKANPADMAALFPPNRRLANTGRQTLAALCFSRSHGRGQSRRVAAASNNFRPPFSALARP